jgi:hypothetical protein
MTDAVRVEMGPVRQLKRGRSRSNARRARDSVMQVSKSVARHISNTKSDLGRAMKSERRRIAQLMAATDEGPDEGTAQLWKLAQELNPDLKHEKIQLIGVDSLDEEDYLPIRPFLKALYQIQRLDMINNCFTLVVFFIILTLSMGMFLRVQDAHEQDQVVLELFYDEEFPSATYKKNFQDVHSLDEFYSWLEGPVVNGIYKENPYGPEDLISGHLRMIGPLRLRQFRMPQVQCRFKNTGTCFAEYDVRTASKESFGPRGTFGSPYYKNVTGKNKYGFSTKATMPSARGRSEFSRTFLERVYGTGGFAVYIPPPSRLLPANNATSATATSLIQELKGDKWIDKATRGVFVEHNLLSESTKIMTASQFYCEFFENGYITCSYRLRTYPLGGFSADQWTRYLLELVTFGIILSRLRSVSKKFLHASSKLKYLMKWKTVLEIAFITTFLLHRSYQWHYELVRTGVTLGDLPSAASDEFFEIFEPFDGLYTSTQAACFCFVFNVILTLQFSKFSRRTAILQNTLRTASKDLAIYMIMVIVFLLGFAQAAHYMYGPHLPAFMSLWTSFREMMGFIGGGYEYDSMAQVAPYFTGIFYWIWLFLMYMIMMNMFIAILTDGYSVSHAASSKDAWQKDLPNALLDLQKHYVVLFYRLKFQLLGKGCLHSCMYAIFCCPCLRKRRSQQNRTVGIDDHGNEQVQHWIAEINFLMVVKQASDEILTARTVVGVKNLYKYIRAFFEEKHGLQKNIYMGISDLCLLFRKANMAGRCDHLDPAKCLARKIITTFRKCYSVFMLKGEKRMEFSQLGVMDVKTGYNEFTVQKINKYGLKQVRIMIVDAEKALIRSFYSNYKLRRVLLLKKLHRIDISKSSKRRLYLTFAPGYYSHCELVFKNEAERKSFSHRVIAHAFGESVKISGLDYPNTIDRKVSSDGGDDTVLAENIVSSVAMLQKNQQKILQVLTEMASKMKINTSKYEHERKGTTTSSEPRRASVATASSHKTITDTIELARQHVSGAGNSKKFNRMSTPDLEKMENVLTRAARAVSKNRRASINISTESRRQSSDVSRKNNFQSVSSRTINEYEKEKVTL